MTPDHVAPDLVELLPDYLADARECLETVSRILLARDRGEADPEHIPELFRQMHVIKGGAGLMGLATVESVAHAAEDVLGAVKRGERELDPGLASALLEGHDVLKTLLDELEESGATATDPGTVTALLRGETGPPAGKGASEPVADAAPTSAAEAPILDDEVVQEFFVESWELIDELDHDLVTLEDTPDDADLLNKIFRAAHTLKGSSSFLGFASISQVTHRVEDIFNKLRKGEMVPSPEVMDVVLEAVDRVRKLMEAAQAGAPEPGVADLIEALAAALAGEAPPPVVAGDEFRPPVTAPIPDPAPAPPVAQEPRVAAPKAKPAQMEQTVRVDVGRLDELMNLVGELVLAKNRLARIKGQVEERWGGDDLVEDLAETSAQVDLVASDLQLAVMKTRLVPIGKVFRKFPRMVRDLCRSLGKEIRLELEGENTELDKSVVEVIGDPLVHLIRNSADHGVEEPEARVRAGKPREGRVLLSACHEGNHIVVAIEDDGKGMDPEALKANAVEKGVLSSAEAGALSDRDAFNLIFAPGFSMAKKVTNVSGRGVGMDVVRTNIQKLNGMIDIESEPGRGTTVRVRIPLTLAIIQALLVRSRREVYAVPLVSVVETVRLEEGDVRSLDGFPVLRLRDQVIPLLHLGDLLSVPQGPTEVGRQYVVVLGLAEKRVGLMVDGLLGEEEVVIKSLGNYLTDVPAIAGATIRGDGRVTLIVDVNQVLALATRMRAGRQVA